MRTATPVERRTMATQLQQGVAHHRAGRLAEACRCYDEALRIDPAQPDALRLLGLAHLTAGDVAAAADAFRRVVRVQPKVAEHRSNLGHCLRLLGEHAEAEASLEAATRIAPEEPAAWVNLGLVRLDRDQIAAAIEAFDAALERDPGSLPGRLNLGTALLRSGRPEAALAEFERVIAAEPALPEGHRNLGMALQLLGRRDAAEAAYGRALELAPADPDVLTNLGTVLAERGDWAASLAYHDRAVTLAPTLAEAWLNRGTALHQAGRLGEAHESLVRAAALDPGPKSRTALGVVEAEQGDLARAALSHEDAIRRDPGYPDAHWNLALALLGGGELARGWEEFEWRWRASSAVGARRSYSWPEWDGSPLEGRRILVWREQGIGDEILLLTCLEDLIGECGLVTVAVDPRLIGPVTRAFPEIDAIPDEPEAIAAAGPFDWHVGLGSLPLRFRRTRAAFPAHGDFLTPTPTQADRWRDRLAALPGGVRVGICWRSGLASPARSRHYPSLDDWAPLWSIPGITWVNLQYDDCDAELRTIEADWGVRVHRWADADLRNDLETCLGLIAGLEAVVTAPTAVSSLAGAVGVRTWQLDGGSDWTALGEERSPWFPTIRVIRRVGGDWGGALSRLGAELTHWVREGRHS
ncbi:MAG: tetratricopeptide repeat protein [Gemmatimonadales bacterium]